jgi:hypothetical protein
MPFPAIGQYSQKQQGKRYRVVNNPGAYQQVIAISVFD